MMELLYDGEIIRKECARNMSYRETSAERQVCLKVCVIGSGALLQ